MESMQPFTQLIVFTRYPTPGRAKTRLIPVVGPLRAAQIHADLTIQCLNAARRAARCDASLRPVVALDGATPEAARAWLGTDLPIFVQAEGHLGARMAAAIAEGFARGATSVILVGTDLPDLNAAHFLAANQALKRRDAVLGPSTDGGYYLIGLNAPAPALFDEIGWGGEDVAATTRARLLRAGLAWAELPLLRDLDTPKDLRYWPELLDDRLAACA